MAWRCGPTSGLWRNARPHWCAEPGWDGHTFKAFIPVVIVGPQAEPLTEHLDVSDLMLLDGKLPYRAGKLKDSGKQVVSCFGVEILSKAAVSPN